MLALAIYVMETPLKPRRILFVCDEGQTSAMRASEFKNFLKANGLAAHYDVSSMSSARSGIVARGGTPFDDSLLANADHIVAVYPWSKGDIVGSKPPGIFHELGEQLYAGNVHEKVNEWGETLLRVFKWEEEKRAGKTSSLKKSVMK